MTLPARLTAGLGERRSRQLARLGWTVAVIAGAWILSSVGYYWLEPELGAQIGYNDAPLGFALYYGAWSGLVYLVFRSRYLAWSRLELSGLRLAIIAAMLVIFAIYALLVIPRLPETEWVRTQSPVEFFYANSWYFLPKSVEILFQQLLIAALILALRGLRLSIWSISGLVAVMFGGFHLSLALFYDNPVYVLRYTVAAAIFGALAPWFILKLRNGFLLSYAVHWTYYAIDLTLIHYVFAA